MSRLRDTVGEEKIANLTRKEKMSKDKEEVEQTKKESESESESLDSDYKYKLLRPEVNIAVLDAELDDLRKIDRQSLAKDPKIKAEISNLYGIMERRKQYAKAFAANLEETNNKYLFFTASGKNMHKLSGNSAIFFHVDISKRLEEGSNLRDDSDTYSKSKIGTVTKVLSQHLISEMERIGINETDEFNYPGPEGDFIVFKLPKAYSKEEIKRMTEMAVADNKKFNLGMMPKNPYPNLFIHITDALDTCIDMNGHLRSYGELLRIGEEVFNNIRFIEHTYLDTASDRITLKDAMLKMRQLVILIKNDLKIIASSSKSYDKASIFRLGGHIMDIEKVISRLLKITTDKKE